MENEYNEDQVRIAEKMLELAQNEYNSEYDRLDRLENKIGKMMILSCVIALMIISQIILVGGNINIGIDIAKCAFIILPVLLLYGELMSFLSILHTEMYIRINLNTELNAKRFSESYGKTVHQIAINFKSYAEQNRIIVDQKVKYFNLGLKLNFMVLLLTMFNYLIILFG